MAKKKETQIDLLEQARGEWEIGIPSFCEEIGITRQWYYVCRENKRDPLSLQALSELAIDHMGDRVGYLAVECIRLIDARFIPCPCQTNIGDNGPCPKHGLLAFVEVPAETMVTV